MEQQFRDQVVGGLATLAAEVRNLRERVDEALERLQEKADTERVAALESKVEALKSYQDGQKGHIAAFTIVGSIIGFLINQFLGWFRKT